MIIFIVNRHYDSQHYHFDRLFTSLDDVKSYIINKYSEYVNCIKQCNLILYYDELKELNELKFFYNRLMESDFCRDGSKSDYNSIHDGHWFTIFKVEINQEGG